MAGKSKASAPAAYTSSPPKMSPCTSASPKTDPFVKRSPRRPNMHVRAWPGRCRCGPGAKLEARPPLYHRQSGDLRRGLRHVAAAEPLAVAATGAGMHGQPVARPGRGARLEPSAGWLGAIGKREPSDPWPWTERGAGERRLPLAKIRNNLHYVSHPGIRRPSHLGQ